MQRTFHIQFKTYCINYQNSWRILQHENSFAETKSIHMRQYPSVTNTLQKLSYTATKVTTDKTEGKSCLPILNRRT